MSSNLHPVMAFALLPLTAGLPKTYQARQGWRRTFASAADAAAYDAAYLAYPKVPNAEPGTPASMAWHDAEEDRAKRDEIRAEHFAEADEVGEYAATHLREIGVHL